MVATNVAGICWTIYHCFLSKEEVHTKVQSKEDLSVFDMNKPSALNIKKGKRSFIALKR